MSYKRICCTAANEHKEKEQGVAAGEWLWVVEPGKSGVGAI